MKERILAPFEWKNISRYKNEIYGFSILWIMLFHAHAILGLDYRFGGQFIFKVMDEFIKRGNMGVETFLFCSGICLYFSYYRNPDIKRFIVKRYTRLFMPVVVISGLYWVWKWLNAEWNVAKFICKLTMLDFWFSGDEQIWFVSLIFVCYIFYPYIYTCLYESKFASKWVRLAVMLVIMMAVTLATESAYPEIYNRIELGLTRFPVFVLGCFAGKYVYEKRTLPIWSNFVAVGCFCITMVLLHFDVIHGAWKRWLFMAAGIPVLFILVWILEIIRSKKFQQFLSFFGKISLNLYVSHILMLRLYRMTGFYKNCRLLHYAVVLVISIIVAWVAEKIIEKILRNGRG